MNFLQTPFKALSMTLLFFLLSECYSEQVNAFDRNVFLASMKDMSASINTLKSLVTVNRNELLARLEIYQIDAETKCALATENTERLDLKAMEIESTLNATRDVILDLERKSKDTSHTIALMESTLKASLDSIAEIKTSVMAPRCQPPSIEIKGLGCVFHLTVGLSWEHQRENCQYHGGKLLEGFNREQSREFYKLFTLKTGFYWIGIRDQQWYTSSQAVVGLDDIWKIKRNGCGRLDWGYPEVSINNYDCGTGGQALCLVNY